MESPFTFQWPDRREEYEVVRRYTVLPDSPRWLLISESGNKSPVSEVANK
jgi:hypothetical protein